MKQATLRPYSDGLSGSANLFDQDTAFGQEQFHGAVGVVDGGELHLGRLQIQRAVAVVDRLLQVRLDLFLVLVRDRQLHVEGNESPELLSAVFPQLAVFHEAQRQAAILHARKGRAFGEYIEGMVALVVAIDLIAVEGSEVVDLQHGLAPLLWVA